MSALHWASREGHERIVKALLDGKYEGRGAEVDAHDKQRYTSLMEACSRNHIGIVRLLLARGAKQEIPNGLTALNFAVSLDRADIVALLCAAPGAAAALARRNRDGRTPLALAVFVGLAACEAVLRAHGAPL